jgi:hypothetical protein
MYLKSTADYPHLGRGPQVKQTRKKSSATPEETKWPTLRKLYSMYKKVLEKWRKAFQPLAFLKILIWHLM